jgi:hypothetical protein
VYALAGGVYATMPEAAIASERIIAFIVLTP